MEQSRAWVQVLRENIGKSTGRKGGDYRSGADHTGSRGHVLGGCTGTGKTMLAKIIGKTRCRVWKNSFTPDLLLPSDITGLNYYNQKAGEFPVSRVLYLPISFWRMRSTVPRRERRQVCWNVRKKRQADGVTRKLEEPFFVIATQNRWKTT